MSENKIGEIVGGVMGATAPVLTSLIKSMLSPEMIKSVVGMVPDLLGAVVEVISPIDPLSIIREVIPAVMEILEPLLDILLSPLIEPLLDMLSPLIKIIDLLSEVISPVMESLTRPLIKGVEESIGFLLSSSD